MPLLPDNICETPILSEQFLSISLEVTDVDNQLGAHSHLAPAENNNFCNRRRIFRRIMAAGSHESERGSFLQSPLDQICEQEQKLVELRRSKGPFDRAVRALTTNIRESYESMILENVSSSESIEQQLWQLHYSFIQEFRGRLGKLKAAAVAAASVPNKKKAVEKQKFERVGGQYKCFLDEASGFYHGLIAKLGAKHGLAGKFSSPGNRTEISSSSNKRFRRCQCVCHRCYIYLGDLSRYKELHLVVEGRTPDWYVAANYYRQASALWPAGGNPHNQLGVLATYAGDNLQALYHYLYSLAVHVPFSTARANAKLLFEKNQRHNSQLSNSPDDDVAIDIEMAQAFESHKSSTESHPECPLARLQRRFRVHFITLLGLLFNKSGLEDFSELSTLVLREAQLLLSQDNALITSSFTLEKSNRFKNQAFSIMQLVVLLIFSVHNVGPKKDKSSRNSQRPEMSPVVMQATIFAFRFMTGVLQDCTRTEEPCCSPLFPAVVVFCNWLSCYPDFCQQIQGDEECEKLQCSFVKEACMLLSKCVQQIGMTKPHDNDSIAYSEKEGHHGTETVLWEDKELGGIVPLKHLETSETALKLSVLAKSAHNVPETACVVRAERLMKALTFLCSVLKLDSSELDAITALSKSAFGWTFMRASPSERIRCSQSSGGSVRTADGSMQLKTQGPCIVQRNIENTLSSPFRKDDCLFPQARDRNSGSAGPAKPASLSCEGSHQHKVISERELKVSRFSEGSALQQPESEPCDKNVESILEDPVRNNVEPKDDGTLCSVGRGALSLGDWVKAPPVGDGNVDASSALEKRTKSRPGASQQAWTHSSGEESLNPSLSFKAVCGSPKPLLVPLSRNAEADDPREKEKHIDLSAVRKETDTHASLSLNLPDAAQDPIDLDCGEKSVEKDGTTLEGLDSSKSRKQTDTHASLSFNRPDTAQDPIDLDCGEQYVENDGSTLEGLESSKSRKQTDTHASLSLNLPDAAQDPIDLDCGEQNVEKGDTTLEGLDSSKSRKQTDTHASLSLNLPDAAQDPIDLDFGEQNVEKGDTTLEGLDSSKSRKQTDTHASLSLNRSDAAQDPIDLDCGEQYVENDGSTLEGLESSKSRKQTDTHASLSLNLPDAAQDPIDLDCGEQNVEKDGTTLEGLDSSKSRKRKHLSQEPLKGSSPESSKGYDAVHQSEEANLGVDSRKSKKQKHPSHELSKGSSPESLKAYEAGHQSEEDGTRKDGDGVDIEPGKQNPLATNLEEVRCTVHDTRTQELNISSQLMFGYSIQSLPDHGVASSQLVADGTVQRGPANLDNQKIVSSVGTPRIGLEDVCPIISGRGKKRKHEAVTPQARSTLPSSRCQNCQGTNPGEGPSERVNGAAPQSRTCRDENAGFSSQLGQGSCKEQDSCSSQGSGMESPFKRPRLKEWNREEFDNWLGTVTHAVPQALIKLASAMRKASLAISDFGGFLEFGAKVNAAKFNLGFEAHHEHPSSSNS